MPDLDLIKQVEQGVRDRRGWTFSPRACPVGAARLWSAVTALFAVIACALPAAAQQAVGSGTAPLALPLHPTEAGKPLIYDPQFVAKSGEDKAGDDRGCAPGFSCRLRLLGVIQNNGAVELRATAFTW